MAKKVNYYFVKNKDLLAEIQIYKNTQKFHDKLGNMILLIVDGLAHRPNFYGYTYIEDMKSEAHIAILKGIKNFDPNKSSNPFGYVTQIAWNAFVGFINKEKKKSKIKNRLFDMQHVILEDNESTLNYTKYK